MGSGIYVYVCVCMHVNEKELMRPLPSIRESMQISGRRYVTTPPVSGGQMNKMCQTVFKAINLCVGSFWGIIVTPHTYVPIILVLHYVLKLAYITSNN